METEVFKTDRERISFLLEADAELRLGILATEGKLDLATEELPEEKRPKYITNFIGSKQKLVDWIWANTPEDAATVLDAFSGSSVVGYMYKTKGLRVFSNDRLAYCHHAARAIVENNNTRLTEQEIDELLKDKNAQAGDFIRKSFKGVFFKDETLALLDNLRANVDALSGIKKSMALFALGKTCVSGGGFGHFNTTTEEGKRHYTPSSFIEYYKRNLYRINALVFDNGKENKAFNGDIVDVAPGIKADLVYFDPPYATQFSSTHYEKAYHFVEGLMTYWKDKEIDPSKKVRTYRIETAGVTPDNAKEFFTGFLNSSKHIPHWLISYRDKAYPTESEIKQLVAAAGKDVRMKSKEHEYSITKIHGDASHAKERLFICAPPGARAGTADEDAANLSAIANMEEIAEQSLESDFDPDLLSAIAGKTDNVLVTGYIGNKHFIMDWIDKSFPRDAKSLFDAFSGGANVAYFYKRKGLQVTTNDIMAYPYHIARAVIENDSETITGEELAALLENNPDAGTFIADTFYGYYYTKPILQFLDNTWANIQKLKGYKKDIALAALGHTCKAKAVFGMFTRSKMNRTRKISDLAEGYHSSSIGNIPVSEFVTAFKKYVRQINGLVYDNGQENKACNGDILKVLPEIKADVIYCDPPYITEFDYNDYETYYHFVEGLMTRWRDKEILDTPRRNYASRTKYTKESMIELIRGVVAAAGRHFPHILISYRDRAFPTENELKDMVGGAYGDVRVKRIATTYGLVRRETAAGGKHANELLFIGSKPGAGAAAKAGGENTHDAVADADFQMKTRKNSQLTLGHSILHRWYASGWDSEGKNETTTWTRDQVIGEHTRLHKLALERNLDFSLIPGTIDESLPEDIKKQVRETHEQSNAARASAAPAHENHTTIIGDIRISDTSPLAAEGISLSDNNAQGDKEFSFILTHAGANKNGDYFTVEELSTRHQTAINKKIDLKHSQDFTDIVGGIIASDFVQEAEKAWVECVGELYTNDNINSRLAYKLIKKGVINQVSMECDYEEGECSVCGKRVRSKADYCIHLKKYKGGEFKGQPVHEILHGITFTGLGLLDRKGADENAKIKQVAEKHTHQGGNHGMDDDNRKPENEDAEAAKKNAPGDGGGADKDARIRDLEKENKDLKYQLDEVQKELDKMREEQAAAARRTRAEKLVKEMENRGVEFADDDDRENEMKRLAGLTDDAFAATEAAVKRIKKKEPKEETPPSETPDGEDKGKEKNKKPPAQKSKAECGCGMSADAGVRPMDVEDGQTPLEERLKNGFMAAYNERVGAAN